MKNIFRKKRLAALFLSAVMLVTLLPSLAFAATTWSTTTYSTPTIWPQYDHPKVMFNASHISTIRANLTAEGNEKAYADFQRLIAKSEKSSTISTLSNSYYDEELENMIEALAFDYVINGNTTNGNYAILRLKDYLKIASGKSSSDGLAYRRFGAALFHAAEVLDWCYPLISSSDASTIMGYCEKLIKKLEIYTKGDGGSKINGQGAISGHGAENQLLRDILAYSIAIYNADDATFNERTLYRMVMGRIQDEYVPVRNYLYQSSTTHQGSEYGWYRFYWDLYAETLVERMRQYNRVTLFDRDAMSQVLYGMIYSRRPDGRFFTEGDNQHTDYWYYNNFNRQVAKLAGDLFANPYFKGEYRMTTGNEEGTGTNSNVFTDNTNFKNYMSFNAVHWLIMNDPDVAFYTQSSRQSGLAPSKYFASPIGKIYARTRWEFSKDPSSNMAAAAEMKIGEQYSANHDHLDAGTFQIYYRGLLSGDYGAQTDYGDSYDINYYKRTVAHNAITIYDSSETFAFGSDFVSSIKNDGGQRGAAETGNFANWKNNTPYKRARVVNHDIASDNSYSYIKGDITNAYNTSKASSVVRSMAFLPTGNVNIPAVMVVFDKVTSKSSSQTKKFLLHTAAEPTVTSNKLVTYDNTKTLTYSSGSATYAGRLTMNTVLPTSATITKVSGTKTNGTSYTGQTDSKFEPEWGRVEVQAASEGSTTRFLHVFTLSSNTSSPDTKYIGDAGYPTLIGSEESTLVGVKFAETNAAGPYKMVTMFANTGAGSLTSQASFTVSGSDTGIKYFIFGVDNGSWTVIKDGTTPIGTFDVDNDGGTIAFTGDAGTYTVKPYEPSDTIYNVVAWYDYRSSDSSSTWTDLGKRGNDLTIPIEASKTFWNGSGDSLALRIFGNSSSVTALPDEVTDAINSGQFTLEFAVSTNAAKADLVSFFGNPRNDFAIYKIMAANRVYIKTPDTRTFINRPHWQLWNDGDVDGYGVSSHHNVITVDTTANDGAGELNWYLDGKHIQTSTYSTNNEMSIINLVSGTDKRVDYKQIKIFDMVLSAGQAASEYSAYVSGDGVN